MHREQMDRIRRRLAKFRYPALILVLGLLLLLLPGKNRENGSDTNVRSSLPQPQEGELLYIEETRLSQLLSQVQGAGMVQVMLSLKSGTRTEFQTDSSLQSLGDGQQQSESTTVLVQGTDRQESALIREKTAPVYQGAVIVCEGAGNPTVRLALVQAVSDLTGLGADCITVIKMK